MKVLWWLLASVPVGILNLTAAGRPDLLSRLESIMGPLPGPERRVDLAVEIHEVSRPQAGVIRQHLSYHSEPGSRVPAYLLLPAGADQAPPQRRFPAVLALHQTHPAGHQVVVGLGNSPDDEYGVELARRGYVVLAPPYPLLAGYAPDLQALGYASGTMKGIWDNLRALDLLASLPMVATNRGFGVIGHSLGGHNGLFTAAFDERLAVVVTSCGFDSFRDYYDGSPDVWRPERGWCSARYMPRLLEYRGRLDALPFDFTDVLAAIAPRPVFVSAPLGDSNFRWQSVDGVVTDAVRLALERQVIARIQVVHPDCGHRFPPEQREHAYRVLDEVLRSDH